MIRRTCTGKAKRLATHEVLETLMENRISAAVGGRVASISPAGTTSEITEHAEGNDDQVLKGCAYQEDFFYNRAANGLRKFEPRAWRNGRLVGRLPFTVRRQGGLFFSGGAPSWAHIAEPILTSDLSDEDKSNVLRELVLQLPRWASLCFVCNPQQNEKIYIQVFKEAGFEHSTQSTYLALPSDPSVTDPNNENGLRKKRLDSIKCARRKLVIIEDLSTEQFIEFYARNLKIQNKVCYDDLQIVRDIISRGRAAGNVVIYTAVAVGSDVAEVQAGDEIRAGDVVASIVGLYDSVRCYYWLTTRLRTKGFSDTVEVLILHAVEQAKLRGVVFDADGVSTNGTKALYERLKFPHTAERNIFTRDDTHSVVQKVGKPIIELARPFVRFVKRISP